MNRLRALAEARLEGAANEREIANVEARAWRESEKKYALMREAERRAEWTEHYLRLAATHEALAAQSRIRAARIAGGGGGR